jgi:hypothetical protein
LDFLIWEEFQTIIEFIHPLSYDTGTWMIIVLELQTGYAIGRPGSASDAHGCLDLPDVLERCIGLIVIISLTVYVMTEFFVVS